MATASSLLTLAFLAICLSALPQSRACKFAALLQEQTGKGLHGRKLQDSIPFNNTNKAEAMAISDARAKATAESVMDYIHKATPQTVRDLVTPVGNYTDAAVFWDSATAYSKFIPGAIAYSIKSIPDVIQDLEQVVATKISSNIKYAGLIQDIAVMLKSRTSATEIVQDSTYARIFDTLVNAINPTITGLALRLSFHDAGTYDPNGKQSKGGANGSIRYEFDWPSNAGLQRFIWPSIWASKQVLDRTLPKPVSYADLCAIAGAVGVYNTHGPLINVGYGRPDVDGPDPFQGVGSNTNQQRDYPIQEIINEWEHYGFSLEDLVVLSGGHSIGFSASTNPQGTISANSRYFSSKYYKQIILGDAFFGSDKALADNNSTLAIVEQLAADQELFYKRFTDHFVKLTWLGIDASVKRLGL